MIKEIQLFITIILLSMYLYVDAQIVVPYRVGEVWGAMNEEGVCIIEPKFDEVFPISEGLMRVKKNGKYGYVNNVGDCIIKCKYDKAEDYKQGYAEVVLKGMNLMINTNGEISMVPYSNDVISNYGIRYQIVQVGDKKRLVSSRINIKPIFSDIIFNSGFYSIGVKNDERKWGIINLRGDTIQPFIYDSLEIVNNAGFYTYRHGKKGFTDIWGVLIAHAKYENLYWYRYCCYTVSDDGWKGYIYKGTEYWRD
jgi:hypothetical protein